MADSQQLNARTEAVLRRLVRKEAGAPLRKVLAKARPEDVAAAMSHLTADEQRRLYRSIDDRDAAASVLSHLEEDSVREIARDMTKEDIVDLLERMEPDDATDVVEMLPSELRNRVVSQLETTDEADLAELLAWPPDSAGGIMSPVVFKMQETSTCGEAIGELQQHHEELEAVFYLYVVDSRDHLVGVVSLRSLLVHPPGTPLVSIMSRDVIAVSARQDQEEVARIVARYDLLGVPVVDDDKRLLGIITVDDVIDVIREEAAEDMMLMAGVQEELDVVAMPVGRMARARGRWLVATLFGGLIAAELINAYREAILSVALLAAFLPVVMGMAGNIGTQSATIAVRGLATGRLEVAGVAQFLARELRVGALLGMGFGTILGVYGMFRDWPDWTHGLVVGLSLPLSMTMASVWGASVPVLLSRLKIDPAVATGPFVTTTMDIIGILVYFNIARFVLGL